MTRPIRAHRRSCLLAGSGTEAGPRALVAREAERIPHDDRKDAALGNVDGRWIPPVPSNGDESRASDRGGTRPW